MSQFRAHSRGASPRIPALVRSGPFFVGYALGGNFGRRQVVPMILMNAGQERIVENGAIKFVVWAVFFAFLFVAGKGFQWLGRKYRSLNVTDADGPLDPGGLPGFGPKRTNAIPSSAADPPAHSAPQKSESAGSTGTENRKTLTDLGKEPRLATDERIMALPATAAASANGSEWYVIHAGKKLGPLSLAELVGKAALGEIGTDDLVKKTGGLWTPA